MSDLSLQAFFIGTGPWSVKLQAALARCAAIKNVGLEIVSAGRDWQRKMPAVPSMVFVATPPQAHVDILPVLWRAYETRPVWVEKPFGDSALNARELVEAWKRHNKPPTYVNFPHLRLHQMMEAKAAFCASPTAFTWAGAIVGGPGPDRTYMNGLWDWGAHVAAFATFFGIKMPYEVLKMKQPNSSRLWATGGIDGFHYMTGNGFSTKTVRYDVRAGSLTSRQPLVQTWDAVEGVQGPPPPPVEAAMFEMLEVATFGAHHGAHPNWDLSFAAQVTQQLETLGAISPYPR